MPVDLRKSLVIGISSRALFDMSDANCVFEKDGEEAYASYQADREDVPLGKGPGFDLIAAILDLNNRASDDRRRAEVVVTSRNSPATSRRLYNSISHYELDIQRSILSGGRPLSPYLSSFHIDLYLTADEADVEQATIAEIPAAVIYEGVAREIDPTSEIRIAFDGDAVLFSDEAERIFQSDGMDAFVEHERAKAKKPLPDGPFSKLLKVISAMQKDPAFSEPPIRTALVTARSMPTHMRVLNTFKAWEVEVDEAYFMGGVDKTPVLEAFKPHIFFDDQEGHCERAAMVTATARVPAQYGPPAP